MTTRNFKHENINTYKDFDVKHKKGFTPETARVKDKRCGFSITFTNGFYKLTLHQSFMGSYKTREACQQVIDKYYKREYLRRLEDKKINEDHYWDDM